MSGEFYTRRERIIEILESSDKPLTVEEIAYALGLRSFSRRELENDIAHVIMTIKRRGFAKVKIISPQCIDCGYVFPRKRESVRKPSKCPRCGSHRIIGPWFKIVRKRSPGP